MRRIIDSDIIALMARIILAGIFIYAAYYKIVDPAAFGKSIWNYHILPAQTINIIAIVLPWLEVLAGIALLVGAYYRGAILWISIMLAFFITALASTIYRG
ncbi:MAG: MauE/DoxX family redox-associated membrane protein, partial [candidate division Zixibacteria bacterium]